MGSSTVPRRQPPAPHLARSVWTAPIHRRSGFRLAPASMCPVCYSPNTGLKIARKGSGQTWISRICFSPRHLSRRQLAPWPAAVATANAIRRGREQKIVFIARDATRLRRAGTVASRTRSNTRRKKTLSPVAVPYELPLSCPGIVRCGSYSFTKSTAHLPCPTHLVNTFVHPLKGFSSAGQHLQKTASKLRQASRPCEDPLRAAVAPRSSADPRGGARSRKPPVSCPPSGSSRLARTVKCAGRAPQRRRFRG